MKKLIVLGIILSAGQQSYAQEILEAYTVSKNLQQESITPYSAKNRDVSSAYHYRTKEEHEIKYGRPILNKKFDDPEVFYDFYEEQVYAYLRNFKKFLLFDLYPEEAYIGVSEKMGNTRNKILKDLEYSLYRARTIQIKDKEIASKQREFEDAFQHLFNDFRDEIPTFIEYYKYQNLSIVNFKRYNHSSTKTLGGHIAQSSLDLLDLLDECEQLLEEPLDPKLKLKYEIRELLDLINYRNQLHVLYREAWHKSEAFFKEVNDKDLEVLQERMDNCIETSIGLMKKMKTIPKYKSDISFKNNVNKYMKYVQTSGKSNFKKIISVIEKSDEITEVEKAKIAGIFQIYKDREKEYLENISIALKEVKNKYLDEAKTNSKDDKEDILKERERLSKEEQREADRARKSYWKNRNLE